MDLFSSSALLSCKRVCGVIVVCVMTTIASHAQTFTTIASFNLNNGRAPVASLVQGVDGNLYSTTFSGGNTSTCIPWGCGTVYKVTPNGTVTTLYNFCSKTNCADGSEPFGGLVLGGKGNFYGTTFAGGVNNRGTVFEITPQGKLTTLYSFCQTDCSDGAEPISGLTLGIDGSFYGTTLGGGVSFSGTAFKISPNGNFAKIYDFCPGGGKCKDGLQPAGSLALATNGKLYGTTPLGGVAGGGTIFQLKPAGVETTVHAFPGPSDANNTANGVMQAADGNLYGTTFEGGNNHWGTVFQLTPSGQFTTLYNFCSQTNCSDGAHPQSQLIQGTDGNLYGTTAGLGGNPYGTAFRITTTGNLTILHQFCPQNFNCTDGDTSQAGLFQSTNGSFYGVTSGGGSSTNCPGGCGTIFSVSMDLAPFVQPNPRFGRAGRVIGILGNDLTGATGVTFNGTPAQFTVVSNTLIKAVVPSGATTGSITVTTPSATLLSNVAFQVE